MGGLHSGGLALAKIVNVVDGFALQICWHIYLCALPVRSSRLDFISSLAAFFFFPLFFFFGSFNNKHGWLLFSRLRYFCRIF